MSVKTRRVCAEIHSRSPLPRKCLFRLRDLEIKVGEKDRSVLQFYETHGERLALALVDKNCGWTELAGCQKLISEMGPEALDEFIQFIGVVVKWVSPRCDDLNDDPVVKTYSTLGKNYGPVFDLWNDLNAKYSGMDQKRG